jgi:hypothetical protein
MMMMGPMMLGRIWLKVMRISPAPSARAARTKSWFRRARVGAPGQPNVLGNMGYADGDDNLVDSLSQKSNDHQSQQKCWKREHDVHKPGDQTIDPAQLVPGHHPDGYPDSDGNQYRQNADNKRGSGSPNDSAQQIAAEFVRTHQKFVSGSFKGLQYMLFGVIVGRNPGRQKGDDYQCHNDNKTDKSGPVGPENFPNFPHRTRLIP